MSKKASITEQLEQLWEIVGHQLEREHAMSVALGLMDPGDDDRWDYMGMRRSISETLKSNEPFGEGGREEVDPAIR